MRLYHRSKDDQINTCKRCLFEARHSRVKLALERLADLSTEDPTDHEVEAEIIYTEGVIRRDFLGQGLKSKDLFERAFKLFPGHNYAIINATQLAPDLEEFYRWAEIFRNNVPSSETSSHQFLKFRFDVLNQGEEYWALLHNLAFEHVKIGEIGQACSLLELALAHKKLIPTEESAKRRWRAQNLRELDRKAEHFRETNREYFPPNERLALKEALIELEEAIVLDKYDPEMWNLKAAWCRMLGQSELAIEAANEAIKLRPHGYAKPHINKAHAFWDLKKDEEALSSAREALHQAQEIGDAADKQQAEDMVTAYNRPRITPTLEDFRSIFERILRSSNILADIEVGEQKGQPEKVMIGFFNRCRKLQGSQSLSYVPILAELLSDFCTERAFQVVSSIVKMPEILPAIFPGPSAIDPASLVRLSQEAYDHCLHAALYIAAHSEGVQQRDAARFLCLVFFGALKPEMIRSVYREAILETSAAATDAMLRLDTIIREELGRIHPDLPHLIADQKPVDDEGRKKATQKILSRFHKKSGCALIAIVIIFALASVMHALF